MAHEIRRPLKFTVVGDGMSGKTIMLDSYKKKYFHDSQVPTVFDNFTANIVVDGEFYRLSLLDTGGAEEFDRIRPMCYPGTDCFIICYSVGSRRHYENISEKWLPELKNHLLSTPIILVATKVDLREDNEAITRLKTIHETIITTEEGMELKKNIKASAYVECSALTGQNLHQVFEEAVRSVVRERTSCCLLS